MSVRSTASGLARKLPFGIGTVVFVLALALVGSVVAVLSIRTPDTVPGSYANGQLRSYTHEPEVAWTQSSDTLPDYGEGATPTVADTDTDRWLLSYPSGLGRAFVMVSRQSGEPLWDAPLVVGLGSCAFNSSGEVACAIKIGDEPDGFYAVDDAGVPTRVGELEDTAEVIGVADNYLRISQSGYLVSLVTPGGVERWTRTFATRATATSNNDLILISTADGSEFVLDRRTGEDQISCAQCAVTVYPTGIAVQHNNSDEQRVVTYGVTDGQVTKRPVSDQSGLRVVAGPSELPVLTSTGPAALQETQGRYEIRDPRLRRALWQITSPELSKANTRPCGALVAFALKDRSRSIHRIDNGEAIGTLPPTPYDHRDDNIDSSRCVGASGSTLVFTNPNQLIAYDAATGGRAWSLPLSGEAKSVDGYLVLEQGASLTVLRPG